MEFERGERSQRPSARPDLKAMQQLQQEGYSANKAKRVGQVPGIAVNDTFLSRCEMMLVGVHHHHLQAMDSMPYGNAGDKVVTALVSSGNYEVRRKPPCGYFLK